MTKRQDQKAAAATVVELDADTVLRINSAMVGWSGEFQRKVWDGIRRYGDARAAAAAASSSERL